MARESSTIIGRQTPQSNALQNIPGLAGTATDSAIAAGQQAAAQLPGYMTSMSNIGANIASETAGEVPEDVINLLKQQGAERNVSTGAASNAAYLHSLGLTSLGLKDTGQKNLESILGVTPGFSMSQNPAFQVTAPLQYEADIQQQIFQRQLQQQGLEFEQQNRALAAAKAGMTAGGWASPTNAWSGGGVDALGFPNTSTATLSGQTTASGYTVPGGTGTMTVYGPGGGPNVDTGPVDYSGLSDYGDSWDY
jgi:hypothetical protein